MRLHRRIQQSAFSAYLLLFDEPARQYLSEANIQSSFCMLKFVLRYPCVSDRLMAARLSGNTFNLTQVTPSSLTIDSNRTIALCSCCECQCQGLKKLSNVPQPKGKLPVCRGHCWFSGPCSLQRCMVRPLRFQKLPLRNSERPCEARLSCQAMAVMKPLERFGMA